MWGLWSVIRLQRASLGLELHNFDPMKFISVQTSRHENKRSFWPGAINDWNSLPPNIINLTSISNLKVVENNSLSAEIIV